MTTGRQTSENYLLLAKERLQGARSSIKNGFYRDSCHSAYYAAFNATHAAIAECDIETPKTHRGLNVLWINHFVGTGLVDKNTGLLLSRIENARLAADYTGDPIDFNQASAVVKMAETFVQAVEALLIKMKSSKENSQ